MYQPAVHLTTKSASMSGQLHLPNPLLTQQQNQPQFNTSHETPHLHSQLPTIL